MYLVGVCIVRMTHREKTKTGSGSPENLFGEGKKKWTRLTSPGSVRVVGIVRITLYTENRNRVVVVVVVVVVVAVVVAFFFLTCSYVPPWRRRSICPPPSTAFFDQAARPLPRRFGTVCGPEPEQARSARCRRRRRRKKKKKKKRREKRKYIPGICLFTW